MNEINLVTCRDIGYGLKHNKIFDRLNLKKTDFYLTAIMI